MQSRTEVTICMIAGGMQLWGVEGWRIVFYTVACVSAVIGLATLAFGRDPNFRGGKRLSRVPTGAERPLRQEIKDLLCCPTFVVIILQAKTKASICSCCATCLMAGLQKAGRATPQPYNMLPTCCRAYLAQYHGRRLSS